MCTTFHVDMYKYVESSMCNMINMVDYNQTYSPHFTEAESRTFLTLDTCDLVGHPTPLLYFSMCLN